MNARHVVCGVDEAGRGPLAGPVYAAAVILAKDVVIDGLGDSKTIPAACRETLAMEIRHRASTWAVASAMMMELHLRYPQYGFDCHKGYATEMHLAALRAHGACEIHRRSFAPVSLMLQTCMLFD